MMVEDFCRSIKLFMVSDDVSMCSKVQSMMVISHQTANRYSLFVEFLFIRHFFRWTVIFHPEKEAEETKMALANDAQVADTNEDTTQMFVMNNYMGFGIDAELLLDFHNARQKNPDKFNSRWESDISVV